MMERYVDAVYNEAATALAQQKLDDSRYLLEKTRRMEELGEKSYPDVAQLEAQVATDEYSLEHQRTATEKAMVELQRVMGGPPAPQGGDCHAQPIPPTGGQGGLPSIMRHMGLGAWRLSGFYQQKTILPQHALTTR